MRKILLIVPLLLLFFTDISGETPAIMGGGDPGLTVYYIYDENGNMLSDESRCFSYNDANQLSEVRDCDSNELIAEYAYDHTGQRVVEKLYEGGELARTVYTIGKQTETVISVGSEREDTTYYRANGELIASRGPDGATQFYHTDHLGSTSTVTDEAGNVLEETRYYPFGAIRDGGTDARYLYTGQEADSETGLYYYGTRFYEPEIRRFTQPDSIIAAGHDPQQINRYSYVANNPLIYVDDSGNALHLPEGLYTQYAGLRDHAQLGLELAKEYLDCPGCDRVSTGISRVDDILTLARIYRSEDKLGGLSDLAAEKYIEFYCPLCLIGTRESRRAHDLLIPELKELGLIPEVYELGTLEEATQYVPGCQGQDCSALDNLLWSLETIPALPETLRSSYFLLQSLVYTPDYLIEFYGEDEYYRLLEENLADE